MSVEDNVRLVRRHHDLLRYYDEATGDAIWAEDIVFHEPHQLHRGRDAMRAGFHAYREAFPDVAATLHEVVAQDDQVAVRYTLEGTHQGAFAGVPATGKRVTLSGIAIFRLADGRIAEGWGCADFLGFLQQLGTVPPGQTGRSGDRR